MSKLPTIHKIILIIGGVVLYFWFVHSYVLFIHGRYSSLWGLEKFNQLNTWEVFISGPALTFYAITALIIWYVRTENSSGEKSEAEDDTET